MSSSDLPETESVALLTELEKLKACAEEQTAELPRI